MNQKKRFPTAGIFLVGLVVVAGTSGLWRGGNGNTGITQPTVAQTNNSPHFSNDSEPDQFVPDVDAGTIPHSESPRADGGMVSTGSLSQAGIPWSSYSGVGPDERGIFGGGRAIRLSDIPAGKGRLREQLEKMPATARMAALRNLEGLSFLESDLDSLNADPSGQIYFGCKLDVACGGCGIHDVQFGAPDSEGVEVAMSEGTSGEPPVPGSTGWPFNPTEAVPITSPPVFHSLPGSQNVLFIDFNGHVIQNTRWNAEKGVASFVCRPFDTDGNPETFSVAEQLIIFDIWKRVAEDYAPFNINVTTEQPAQWTSRTGHALVTPSIDANGIALPHNGYTGVAATGGFGNANYSYNAASNIQSPAWVLPSSGSNYSNTAELVSHEIGHNFGLLHHGFIQNPGGFQNEYYPGHAATPQAPSWAPIMGSPYGRNVTQWSKGEYTNALRPWQDDIQSIASKTGFRPDNHGNDAATATSLPLNGPDFHAQGVIIGPDDVDVFAIPSGGGPLSVTVQPYRSDTGPWGGNLDAQLVLYNESGEMVATSNPPGETSASISASVPAGTYFAFISPVGAGSPTSTTPSGYTVHGSRGSYTISGSTVAPPVETQPIVSVHPTSAMWHEGQRHTLTVTASGSNLRYQWRKNGSPISGAGFRTFTVDPVSLADGGNYDVVVSNSAGSVTSNTAIITLNAKPVVTVTSPSNPNDIRLPSGSGVELAVSAIDDGAGGGTLTSSWAVIQSPFPDSVFWDNQDSMVTAARFNHDGQYVLRYSASDGTLVTTRDFFIQVGAGQMEVSPNSLVLNYPMNETSGTTIFNAAGSGYNGTLVGGGGFQGSALLLNGGYVTIPSGPEIDTAGPYAKRTVDLRFKRSANGNQVLYEEGGWTAGYYVMLTNTGSIRLRFWNTLSGVYREFDQTLASSTFAVGQWNHLAIVLDATPGSTVLETGALRLYLNGGLFINGNGMPLVSHPDGIGLGGINQSMRTGSNSGFSGSNGGLPFSGEIDHLLIYNRALTDVEIERLYRSKTVNLAPAVYAGETATGIVDSPIDLTGSATDPDGPQAIALQWSKVSGPGTIIFSDASSLGTSVTASLPGTYWLRLTANDGQIRSFADVRLELLPSAGASMIRFETASNNVGENSGNLHLQVRRIGTAGAASVSYEAENATAVNGTDYQLSPGTLFWADQEDGLKTISVSTIDNLLLDGNRTFQVRLLDPAGAATLGSPDVAGVTILDDDSPIPPHHGMEIVFQNLEGRETLKNFPALVKLSPANTGNYAGFLDSTNGWDLRVWTEPGMRGAELAYEIESFNPSGESMIWVKIPEFAQGGSIWVTWGNAGYNFQAPYTTNGDVWSEGFAGVWHLGETDGAADLTDSTANNNHADLDSGTVNAEGLIGKGQSITTRGSYIRIPDSPSLSHTGSITLEAWGNLPSFPTGSQNIMAKDGNNGFRYRIQNSGGTFWSLANNGSGSETHEVPHAFSPNTWHHLTCVMDFAAGQVRFHVDGTQVGEPQTLTLPAISNTDGPLLLGAYLASGQTNEGFVGLLDEMRISNLVRSPDWIWASATNQGASHATLQTYGPLIIRPDMPPITPPSHLVATAVNGHHVDLSWSDNSDDETGFIIERSTSADSGFIVIATAASNVTGYSDFTTVAHATFYYRIRAVNATNTSSYSTAVWVTTPTQTVEVTLGDLDQKFDGNQKPIRVFTVPEGISVHVSYNNNSTPPAALGSYSVVATVDQPGYSGSATGTLVISKTVPTITTWPTAANILPGQPLSAATLSGGVASVAGSFGYEAPGTVLGIGTHAVGVTFTPADTALYTAVSGTVDVTISDLMVPNVLGETQASAESMITDAGLEVGTVSMQNNASIPAGLVISQNPVGEAIVSAGTLVDLVISAGPLVLTVTFDANGGSSPSPSDKQVTGDETYGTLATTTRAGHTFLGWFTAPAGGTEMTGGTLVSATVNHTLHAQWNALPVVDAGPNQVIPFGELQPWTPERIITRGWYDPSDLSTVVATDGNVTALNDKSGNNRHLSTAGTGNPAKTGTDSLGGRNVIRFDGSARNFIRSGFPVAASGNLAIFTVAEILNVNNAFQTLVAMTATNEFQFQAANNNAFNGTMVVGNIGANKSLTGGPFPGSSTYGLIFDKTGSGFYNAFIDGSKRTTDTAYTTNLSTSQTLLINRNKANNRYLNCRIGEIIITDDVSLDTRRKIEGYLAHKWGTTAKLPAGHPYKTEAPSVPSSTAVATLQGSVSDAENDSLTFSWSVLNGPAAVSFSNTSALATTAAFTEEGVYTLRLTSGDGFGTNSDDIVITVGDAVAPNPFEEWAGGGEVTFTGDSNSDALADGLAWLLGAGNPAENAASLLPAVVNSGGNLVVSFDYLVPAKRGGASLRLQHSRDVGFTDPWEDHTIAIPDVSGTVDGVAFVISPDPENANVRSVQATVPAEPGGRIFVRLVGIFQP